MSLFIPITKVDIAKRLVYGTLSEEIPDKAGEILDYESAKPAFMEWSDQFRAASGGKSLGNVRAMHGSVAAGKLTGIAFDDARKRIQGVAKIVDDDEWQKVCEGVYTGFSIGGGYARRWPDVQHPELMRYTPSLSEVSLVDNPAVPTATFEVIKQDGTVELRKFTLNKEMAAMTDMPDNEMPDYSENARLADIIDGLEWLLQMAEEQGDDDILAHIHAVLTYLDEEGARDNEDDDTSSHAYANELARMARSEGRGAGHEARGTRSEEIWNHITALQKRIAQLEAQPLPAKGAIRALGKSDDRITVEEGLAKLPPADRARELMKIALSQPVEM